MKMINYEIEDLTGKICDEYCMKRFDAEEPDECCHECPLDDIRKLFENQQVAYNKLETKYINLYEMLVKAKNRILKQREEIESLKADLSFAIKSNDRDRDYSFAFAEEEF